MEQEIFLSTAGSLPGIPGSHGPGSYLVDYEARTIRPKPEQEDSPALNEDPPAVPIAATEEIKEN